MREYRSLNVWSDGRELALTVYEISSRFPPEERFGLSSQMRRSAVSIISNIAESCGRGSEREFARFLRFATGSAFELEAQLDIAVGLGFIDSDAPVVDLCNKVKRSLTALVSKLNTPNP